MSIWWIMKIFEIFQNKEFRSTDDLHSILSLNALPALLWGILQGSRGCSINTVTMSADIGRCQIIKIFKDCFIHLPGPATFPLSDLQTPFPRMCCCWIKDCCRSHPIELHWLVPLQHCWVNLSLLLQSFELQKT